MHLVVLGLKKAYYVLFGATESCYDIFSCDE